MTCRRTTCWSTDGRLVLIDLPQIVDVIANPQGADFLARDVRNVATWFAARGLPADMIDVERPDRETALRIGAAMKPRVVRTRSAAAGRTRWPRPASASLEVALDLAGAVGLHGVRVAAHLAGGAPPAQQVPALVQGLLELLEPGVLLVAGDLAAAQLLTQLVLLVDQAVDPAQHSVVIHARSLCRRPALVFPTLCRTLVPISGLLWVGVGLKVGWRIAHMQAAHTWFRVVGTVAETGPNKGSMCAPLLYSTVCWALRERSSTRCLSPIPRMVVGVRLRSRVLVCPCGRTSRARYDSSRRRWRHVDFGRYQVLIEAEIRRVDCRRCERVRTEWMPWARPGARHTRDFEDLAGWLVKRMSKAGVAALLRTTWHTVDALVRRLVGEHLDDDRLDGLYRIGVDEIAYRKGRKFLTVVTDHDTGRVVYLAEGRTSATLAAFYQQLGPRRCALIRAVTMDMTRIYREPTREYLPQAAICSTRSCATRRCVTEWRWRGLHRWPVAAGR